MPSGRTHDAITVLLTIPIFVVAFGYFGFRDSALITLSFLIGGLVFGPDLDTKSVQFRRWSIFRFLWIPYRIVVRHRSIISHGLFIGTFFRVLYFVGVITLCALVVATVIAYSIYGKFAGIDELVSAWKLGIDYFKEHLGEYVLIFIFLGLWLGAASHILSDKAFTYLKTGRIR